MIIATLPLAEEKRLYMLQDRLQGRPQDRLQPQPKHQLQDLWRNRRALFAQPVPQNEHHDGTVICQRIG